LLEEFRDVFNVQSFPIFVELMTGWGLSHRHRFITDLIVSSGSVGKRHFSNYHRFFSQYAWKLDVLSRCLLLLVRVFAPSGVIVLTVDDTLARKRGLMVSGTGMQHDPLMSSRAKTTNRSLRYKLSRWLESRVVRKATCVVTIAEGLRTDVLGRGIADAKVFVVPNGVDVERFQPRPPDEQLKSHLDLGW